MSRLTGVFSLIYEQNTTAFNFMTYFFDAAALRKDYIDMLK